MLVGGNAASATEANPHATSGSESAIGLAQSATERLPADSAKKASKFTREQQERVGKIIADPDFGDPSSADALEKRYPEVEIVDTVGPEEDSPGVSLQSHNANTQATKNGTKSKSLKTEEKVLGVTYASITTTMSYSKKDWRIKKINDCYGTIVNYIPLRQIDKHNTHSIAKGHATCITNASLARPAQKTVHGKHGFTVDGNDKIIKQWRG